MSQIVQKKGFYEFIFNDIESYKMKVRKWHFDSLLLIISSPGQLGSQCELIVYPCSVALRSRCPQYLFT